MKIRHAERILTYYKLMTEQYTLSQMSLNMSPKRSDFFFCFLSYVWSSEDLTK